MALTSEDANRIVLKTADRHFADATNKYGHFFRVLQSNGRVLPPSNGNGPQWDVKVTGHSGASLYREGDPLPAGSEFKWINPSLRWVEVVKTLEVTEKKIIQLQHADATTIGGFFARQMQDMAQETIKDVEYGILGVNLEQSDPIGFAGVQDWIDDAGTELAGINRTTYPEFKALVTDASSGNLTNALMDDTVNLFQDVYGGTYTHVFASKTQEQKYARLSDNPTKTVFLANGERTVNTPGGSGTTDPTIPRTFFNSAPFLGIPRWGNNRVDFLNINAATLEVAQDTRMAPRLEVRGRMWIWHIAFMAQFWIDSPRTNCCSIQQLA